MPHYFTPYTSLTLTNFDYDKFFDSIKTIFGHLSFYNDWCSFWNKVFSEMDNQTKEYMNKYPNSNPILQRVKYNSEIYSYEMYNYEQITEGGAFYFHFDVEKMKNYIKHYSLPVETLSINSVHIDPETPVISEFADNDDLPFFVRMFGIEKPFICADGNKRIKAKMEKGQRQFKGYIFDDKTIINMFFGVPDEYYYMFFREMELMNRVEKQVNSKEQDILEVTQMYHQTT